MKLLIALTLSVFLVGCSQERKRNDQLEVVNLTPDHVSQVTGTIKSIDFVRGRTYIGIEKADGTILNLISVGIMDYGLAVGHAAQLTYKKSADDPLSMIELLKVQQPPPGK